MLLHPDRFSTSGVQTRKNGVVIHDSESGDGSCAVLIELLKRPGDRVIPGSNPPRKYGSGYAAVTDGNGGYIEIAEAHAGPYHAPPLNKNWWSICIPGRAAQTRDEWLDQLSYNHIRGVAKYVVAKSRIDGFPLTKIDFHGLLAGDRGYCSHADVSQAWGQTDHTDPGKNFPWDILQLEIQALITPPEPPSPPTPTEDPVHIIVAIKNPADTSPEGSPLDNRRFAWDGISIRHIASEEEFRRLYGPRDVNPWALFNLHPSYATLAKPYLLTLAEIRTYVGGSSIS